MKKIIDYAWYISLFGLLVTLGYSYIDTRNTTFRQIESLQAEINLLNMKIEAGNQRMDRIVYMIK